MASVALAACGQEVRVQNLNIQLIRASRYPKESSWPLGALLLTVFAIMVSLRSRAVLRDTYTLLAQCKTNCVDAKCLSPLYEDVKGLRNTYLDLYNFIPSTGKYSYLHKMIEKDLTAWDDLVEDLAINTDQEIRGLVEKIADIA